MCRCQRGNPRRCWPGRGGGDLVRRHEKSCPGLVDGDLHGPVDSPLYVTLLVWSHASIAQAFATGLIGERDETAIGVLEDPVVAGDAMAVQ